MTLIKEHQIYDPNTKSIYTPDGELLQIDVVIRPLTKYEKVDVLSKKQVDKLSKEQVRDTINRMYRFDGVRIERDYGTKKRLMELIDHCNINDKDAMRIYTLQAVLSSRQAILYSPRKHCKKWNDLMKIKQLRIESRGALARFTKVLKRFDIARLHRNEAGDTRIIYNPAFGYNNTILFRDTYHAYGHAIQIPYIAQRFFELGFDSTIKTK